MQENWFTGVKHELDIKMAGIHPVVCQHLKVWIYGQHHL